jgi:CRISPR-associated endoribonuclease Cas6
VKSTLITVDVRTEGVLREEFTGSIFRGWLGYVLKCSPESSCEGCEGAQNCSYFMVFKERASVKPYALLSFKQKNFVRNFVKIHGDRRKFTPQILSCLKEGEHARHFGGLNYSIESLEARNIEIFSKDRLSKTTTLVFISPVHLIKNRKTEVIPTFNSIITASLRAFNRISKYYAPERYPYKISEELATCDAPIEDFDIKTKKFFHNTMDGKSIILEGSMGWVRYDTSRLPAQAGELLRIGEFLQIGKHTTYGLGGFLIREE